MKYIVTHPKTAETFPFPRYALAYEKAVSLSLRYGVGVDIERTPTPYAARQSVIAFGSDPLETEED